MAWLRKHADLVEVVVNNPTGTKTGTCALCDQMGGQPTSEVGQPPFHPHCACKTTTMERSLLPPPEPEDVLDEPFTMAPDDPEPETGGVTDLEEAADES